VEWRGRIGPTDEVILSEAADMLGLSSKQVRHLVELGDIPARTNRFLTYISLADIEIYRLRTRVGISSAVPQSTGAPRWRLISAGPPGMTTT
jgi:hypothetical protein